MEKIKINMPEKLIDIELFFCIFKQTMLTVFETNTRIVMF
jgi:hypothetical protein